MIDVEYLENDFWIGKMQNFHCPRCGRVHEIEFVSLTNPSDLHDVWGMCSNTKEPVLYSSIGAAFQKIERVRDMAEKLCLLVQVRDYVRTPVYAMNPVTKEIKEFKNSGEAIDYICTIDEHAAKHLRRAQ